MQRTHHEMPEKINVEAGELEEEVVYIPPPYAIYEHINELGYHITDINNLADDLLNTSFDLTQQFYAWGNGWVPGSFQPPPQWSPMCLKFKLGEVVVISKSRGGDMYLFIFSLSISRLCS